MNALQFVQTAKQWETVPEQSVCVTEYDHFKTKNFTNSTNGAIKFKTTGCRNEQNEVRFIEHVQLVLDIEADVRGHISLWLESPEGTLSQLISPRPLDVTDEGFKQWPFTTVHMWGENPSGVWTLHVHNGNLWKGLQSNISIKTIKLVIFGTKQAPLHYMEPRKYRTLMNIAEKTPISLKPQEM
uniref:P/Homo B domain-containing protein n=1 Tax=Ditylenchus dipsaci TaxID=166011 RepID=A0A915EM14_9BILA